MADDPAAGSERAFLLTEAKNQRVIAARFLERAAQTTNPIDEVAFIACAEELQREAAQLEAEAAKPAGDRH